MGLGVNKLHSDPVRCTFCPDLFFILLNIKVHEQKKKTNCKKFLLLLSIIFHPPFGVIGKKSSLKQVADVPDSRASV